MDSLFYKRLGGVIKQSDKNLRTLEDETGISRSKLGTLGKGGRLYADEVPKICSALGVGFETLFEKDFQLTTNTHAHEGSELQGKMNALANQFVSMALDKVREEIGGGIDLGQVIKWYHATGGRLADHDRIADYFSIFEEPETPESPLVALKVGEKSLARESLKTRSPEAVTEYAASLSRDARFEIMETYHHAKTTQRWTGTSREVDVKFRTVEEPFILTYDIAIFPVTTPDGTNVMLNFSQLSSVRPLRSVTDRETRLGTSHSTLLSD